MESALQMMALPDGCDPKQPDKWRGSLVAGSDGATYAAPCNAAGVLRVDLATRTTSLLALPDGCDAEQVGKWVGSLVAGSDGAMYAAPRDAAGVLWVAGAEEGEPPATAALRAELGERSRRIPVPNPPFFFGVR